MNDDDRNGADGVLVHRAFVDEPWPARVPGLAVAARAPDEIAEHRAVIEAIDRDLLPKVPTDAMREVLTMARSRFSDRLSSLLAAREPRSPRRRR